MPFKLSALDGITDGITGGLHSTMGAGTSAHLPSVLHDGGAGQLVSAVLDGSPAPVAAAALLLAAGGLHVLRNRPTLAFRSFSV